MANPIKTWFFELIEDAIGSKAMKQFKEEEGKKKEFRIKWWAQTKLGVKDF